MEVLLVLGGIALAIWFVSLKRPSSPPNDEPATVREQRSEPGPAQADKAAVLAMHIGDGVLKDSLIDFETAIDTSDEDLKAFADEAVRAARGARMVNGIEELVYQYLRLRRAEAVQHSLTMLLKQAVKADIPVPPRIAAARTTEDYARISGDEYYEFKHAVMRTLF